MENQVTLSETQVGLVWRIYFSLIGSKTTSTDRLIRGTCFINGILLISIIDMGETYSFISLECAERLNLDLSSLVGSMIVNTSALDPLTTLWVCLNCPLIIYGKNFGMDLVCLMINKLDVILVMNWLEFNQVHINCFYKSVSFLEFVASDELFLLAKQVGEFMKNGAKVFMILASMKAEIKTIIGELPMVCNFPEVFPDDISDLPLEREVEFVVDLVPKTIPVLMAMYRMPAS